jgi:aspartyl-tRNA(Asn)/glutamyl-tRNA(Gln) amidotransferase subunit A
MNVNPSLWQLSATQLVAGFRAASFTPVDALDACLARCAQVDPRLNALVALDADGARRAAEQSRARWRAGRALGELDGVPLTIKDNLQVRGLPTRWGSAALAGFVAEGDELPVVRLREAGVVIFGKTNVPEFTMQGYTDNPVFGATRNPWNPALTPGGSSGGAVALVAAGGCPLALATDGGGSIRRPASHTNLVGFKPSRGRVPRAGGLPPIFLDFEVAGPIARCVDDVVALMRVIGTQPVHETAATSVRILHVPRFADHPVDPQIAGLTDAAACDFAALGHTLARADSFYTAEAVNARWPLLSQVGLAWLVAHPRELWDRPFDAVQFGPAMRASVESGRDTPATALFELLFEIERMRGEIDRLFEQHDVLLMPAAAALPWPARETHPQRINDRDVGPRGHAVFTAFANAAGLPAIVLPCGFAQGMPVGVQLVAREGADDLLLALARQFERAHSWQRFPEI